MGANTSCQVDGSPVRAQALFAAEKKRRITSLALIRKKWMRRRRSSKFCDHNRIIRDFLSSWAARDISALWEEYEAAIALKDLTIQADLARPPAPTYKQDLSDIFHYKFCTDVDLVFQGTVFPVHRAILSVRCRYFQEILKKIPGHGAQIAVDIRTPGIDVPMFSALLHFLYTGELNSYDCVNKSQQLRFNNMKLLMQLCDEFGKPNSLENDLRYLLESGDYADCVLTFSSSSQQGTGGDGSTQSGEGSISEESSCPSDYGFHNRLEIFCHKAVLSARSPFFRSMIQRREKFMENERNNSAQPQLSNQPSKIVLDESVIPKRYAKVLLQAIYIDTLNLSAIVRDSTSTNSLSEAQSIVKTGRSHLTAVEEAIEIYQIGRFLELDILTQSCEDLIIESLSLENLISVLKWSRQSHGSASVHRQALNFLREEFTSICQSPVLLELDKNILIEMLISDFLQASELEILQAVIKWGEHHLLKRMEEREPNLVSQTTHSVSKKGVKKRDLNDVELRDILSDLLPLVRMDHVLPTNHELFNQAVKRGLVSTPPSHMLGDEQANRVSAWVRGKSNGLFVKPRLFTPYAEEVKSLMDELISRGRGERPQYSRSSQNYVSNIPDALYMIDSPPLQSSAYFRSTSAGISTLPLPDTDTMLSMLQRERELLATPMYQRSAGLLFSDRRKLKKQIRLRIIREFNLPDSIIDFFDNYGLEELERENEEAEMASRQGRCHTRDERCSQPHLQTPEFLLDPVGGVHASGGSIGQDYLMEDHIEGHLSEMVPDVALASASMAGLALGGPRSSTLGRQRIPNRNSSYGSASLECLEKPQMVLDLGDGSHQFNPIQSNPISIPPLHSVSPNLIPLHPTHSFSPPYHSRLLFETGLQPNRVLDDGVRSLHRRHYSDRFSPRRFAPQSTAPSPPLQTYEIEESRPIRTPFAPVQHSSPALAQHVSPLRHFNTLNSRRVTSLSSAPTIGDPHMFL